jgi:hypothetical protein
VLVAPLQSIALVAVRVNGGATAIQHTFLGFFLAQPAAV